MGDYYDAESEREDAEYERLMLLDTLHEIAETLRNEYGMTVDITTEQ